MARATIHPISSSWQIYCPNCQAAICEVSNSSVKSINAQYWLTDGDTIPMAEVAERDAAGISAWPQLFIGRCDQCYGNYSAVEIALMRAPPPMLEAYIVEDKSPGTTQLAQCRLESAAGQYPSVWLVELQDTADGPIHKHTIGPFRLENLDDVVGCHGVSPCEGRADAEPWVFARGMINALQQAMDTLLLTPVAR